MYTMHLLPCVAIRPNLELKTRPKQLLGSLPLVIALPSLHETIIPYLASRILGRRGQGHVDLDAGLRHRHAPQ